MWSVDSGKAFHFVKCNHLGADRGKKVIRRRMASRQDKDTLSLHHQQYNSKEYFLSIWLHVLAGAYFWISSLKNLAVYMNLTDFFSATIERMANKRWVHWDCPASLSWVNKTWRAAHAILFTSYKAIGEIPFETISTEYLLCACIAQHLLRGYIKCGL